MLGDVVNVGLGRVGFMVALDLKGLFQPKRFCDSKRLSSLEGQMVIRLHEPTLKVFSPCLVCGISSKNLNKDEKVIKV